MTARTDFMTFSSAYPGTVSLIRILRAILLIAPSLLLCRLWLASWVSSQQAGFARFFCDQPAEVSNSSRTDPRSLPTHHLRCRRRCEPHQTSVFLPLAAARPAMRLPPRRVPRVARSHPADLTPPLCLYEQKTIAKKEKKAKDPNAPKRPLSAYFEYVRFPAAGSLRRCPICSHRRVTL